MRCACTPHEPAVVATIASIQTKEAPLVSRDVDPSLSDGGLERDGFTDIHFPQDFAGLGGEGVDLAGAGPNKCLAIDYAGRSQDTLDDGGLFVIMQGARPDRFAGLRIDALS